MDFTAFEVRTMHTVKDKTKSKRKLIKYSKRAKRLLILHLSSDYSQVHDLKVVLFVSMDILLYRRRRASLM